MPTFTPFSFRRTNEPNYFTLLSLLVCPLTAHAEEGWEYKTLFLDDHHVAEISGLCRVMHRPMKKGKMNDEISREISHI